MFARFTRQQMTTSGATIQTLIGGTGSPLLLIHGYPQTHVMWHQIADQLAREFQVVLVDLRGYGDSSKPASDPLHQTYSKRMMAQDLVEVMDQLGLPQFAVAGHDRGGRVAHRLVRDHPQRVTRLAVLDIVPTAYVFEHTDRALAQAYYHWFFLSQPYDLPERLIGADPDFYLERKLAQWGRTPGAISAAALAEYQRCFRDPATIHASCEDYRAAASIDLTHDAADRQPITCPLLVLWGTRGFVGSNYDPLTIWRQYATRVEGYGLPCGHFLPEEDPQGTLNALQTFFRLHDHGVQ